MINRFTFFAFVLLFFSACKPANVAELEAQLTEVKAELDVTKAALIIEKAPDNTRLIHTVYLKLKPETTAEEKAILFAEIQKIAAIEGLYNLQIGEFADLGDARAMSDLTVAFQMGFMDEKAYQNYQKHPVHLELKKAVGQYLAGPPVTHDFWLK